MTDHEMGHEVCMCVYILRTLPPGIIRSAPPTSTGITKGGVERIGKRFGRFHRV